MSNPKTPGEKFLDILNSAHWLLEAIRLGAVAMQSTIDTVNHVSGGWPGTTTQVENEQEDGQERKDSSNSSTPPESSC